MMTYKELNDRLAKCESTLEKIKNGSYATNPNTDIKKTTEKLTILRESLQKQIAESEETMFVTNKAGDTKVVKMDRKTALGLKSDPNVTDIDTAKGQQIKEDIEFSIEETKAIAKKVGKAVAIAIKDSGDEISTMKAKKIEPNSFEIYVEYKKDIATDEFSFYITDDTLHLTDFSFDKELVSVGVKPSGEAVVHVDHLANELAKHFKSMNEDEEEDAKNDADYEAGWYDDPRMDEAPEGKHYIKVESTELMEALGILEEAFADTPEIKFELNDPDTIYVHGADNADMHDAVEELKQNGIIVDETSIDDDLEEGDEEETDDYKYKGKHQGTNYKWPMSQATKDRKEADKLNRKDEDIDVGHQDDEPDMLQSTAFETAQYAAKLVKKLQKYDNFDGEVDFPNWWQSKLILAKDYMQKAYHYLDSEEKQPAIDQLALEGKDYSKMHNVELVATYKDKFGADSAKGLTRDELIKGLKSGTIDKDKESKFKKAGERAGFDMRGINENRFLAASMEDLEQVIRNLAHTGEMSEDEAIELAIRKLEAMLDGRDDMDEGRKDNDALFPDNPRLPEIKKLADKIVSMVKAEAAQGDLGYIKTMEEIRYQQEDDFERTPEWNKAKGIRADFDDYGSGTNEGLVKTQKAYSLVVAKMKELAKQYKAGDTSVVAQLKDLTAKKKQLEKQLEKDVAGKNRGQQLDTSVNEYRGVQDDLINIIKDKAEDSGFSHEEETEEVIEFLQGIEFDDNGSIAAVYEEVTKEAAPGFKHDCAAKVVHEKYGEGNTIPEKHTLVKEGSKYVVTHYDVLFESGKTVKDIPVSELDIKTSNEHWHKGYKKKKK